MCICVLHILETRLVKFIDNSLGGFLLHSLMGPTVFKQISYYLYTTFRYKHFFIE